MSILQTSKGFCSFFCLLWLIFIQLSSANQDSRFRSGSVYCKNRQCVFSNKPDWQLATAVGTFNDTLLTTGWGILDISAGHTKNVTYSNQDIMYAAGYLEGVLTARHIESHYANMRTALLPVSKVQLYNKLKQWFLKQRQWTDVMVAKYGNTDPLWRHIGYILAQKDGLYAGYKSVRQDKDMSVDMFAIDFLNANGDLLDLLNVLSLDSFPDWTKFSPQEARRYFHSMGHCSALIKLLPGFENLYMSHSSWFIYQATNRIFKHYNLNVNDAATVAKKISFSSYPAYLESLDDFYLLSSGLVMLQTTINVFDKSLYTKVVPESLFAWQRVRAANMMARSGQEWTQIIHRYNSGTYNNEYMVIDVKRFKPSQPLPDGTLWVANQIPGLVLAADATPVLRSGYFPSYNIPFFEEIFNKSGNAAYAKLHGLDYTYDLAPRAKIFRRDQSKVSNMQTMKNIMRYNDFKNDSYSGGSPWGAICARGDLAKDSAGTAGCYDTKVSDFAMATQQTADIISGPTLGTDLPPFSWTGPFAQVSHKGLPLTYKFDFIRAQPRFP